MTVDPMVLVGAVLLLAGWVAIPLAMRVVGLFTGVLAGLLLVSLVDRFGARPGVLPEWVYLAGAAVLGLVMMFAITRLFSVVLFVAGCLIFAVLYEQLRPGEFLATLVTQPGLQMFLLSPWFAVIWILLGSALLLFLKRFVIIVLSCMAGVEAITYKGFLMDRWFVLLMFGLAFQSLSYLFFRRRRKHRI